MTNKQPVKKENTFYLYANNTILKPTDRFEQIYEKHKSSDGFLYVKISDIPSLGVSLIY